MIRLAGLTLMVTVDSVGNLTGNQILSGSLIRTLQRTTPLAFRAMSTRAAERSVLCEQLGTGTGLITINRPKALNAINLPVVQQITETMTSWQQDGNKRLVIVKGAGDRAFSAGGDVLTFFGDGSALEEARCIARHIYRLIALIESYKPDYVAIMDGITMGTGVGIAVHGRYRVATERTVFAMPEATVGYFPDVGSGYLLPRLQGKLGLYLGLTGLRLKGKDVAKAGIATHYVESKDLQALEQELTATSNSSEVAAVLNKFNVTDSSEFVLAKDMQRINECFSGSTMESIFANLEQDGSEWALGTLKTLNKMSPLSMKITKKHLDLDRYASLRSCLRTEFRLFVHCMLDGDFREGVRALLVDRDQNPKWIYLKFSEITDEQVEPFFGPLPDGDELIFEDEMKARL